jgi:UDP-N-acetylmuramate--alanine ligase
VPVDLTTVRRIHLVGVGGAGMSGIARILLQRGHTVSGTDLHEGRALDELRAMGGRVQVGHDAAALGDAEVVVTSTAVPATNPEVAAARERGLEVVRRAEMLAALMAGDTAVLVAGTHGKTTTTSMTVVALQAAGRDPSFAIGGQLNEAGTNAHAGADRLFVAEADESDRSFLVYRPDVAVVTNLELDHPDEYADLADVTAAFEDFLRRRSPGAPAVLCLDDPGTAALAGQVDDVLTYGEDPRADAHLVVTSATAGRVRIGGTTVDLDPAVPGRHKLRNAAAALAVVSHLGGDPAAAAAGLASFTGAQRRYQRLGTVDGVAVVDDYAHHPTELRATLAAARSESPERIVLVVQPHRYWRTEAFGDELGRAAAAADLVVVTDVYGAGETPKPGVSGATVHYEPHLGSVAAHLASVAQPGDLVLVTGAGDVTQVGPALLARLAERA